jgi:FtsP/CotA-like multicopper oxidase with cupredoxin domain
MKRLVPVLALAVGIGLAWSPPGAAQVVQTPIKTNKIPQFVDPLPLLEKGLPLVDGMAPAIISICEFQTQILPAGSLGKKTPAPWTWVWGYHRGPTCPQPNQAGIVDGGHSYIGPVVVAARGTPTNLTFINQLPPADPYGILSPPTSNVLAFTQNTDQTMHWADPLNLQSNNCSHALSEGHLVPLGDCPDNYTGPVAAAVHLHGGEVPPDLDGGPDSWWTPDGDYRGHGYYTREVDNLPNTLPDIEYPPGVMVYNHDVDNGGLNAGYNRNDADSWTLITDTDIDRATYVYPNLQEAANIWFHDHVLGMTRLNVYAGIAGAYVITDPVNVHPALHNAKELVPLVIQDRMFDTNGQLFFGAGGTTPEHPWWIPEFIGDVIVVNGKAWPYLNVEAKKYRFLFLNGSNARAYDVRLKDITNGLPGPSMWVIGTDGGFLDAPALIDNTAMPPQTLVVMPGERYEVVIDFSGVAPGTILRMENKAGTPFPFGQKVDGSTTKRVMEFRVVDPNVVPVDAIDTQFDPTTMSPREHPIVALGGIAPVVRRQLTLNEIVSKLTGTPLEALLNNTKWNGYQIIEDVPTNTIQPRLDFDGSLPSYLDPTYYSELPYEGTVEHWEIINITADAHPIHLHLVQFQILERQPIDPVCYNAIYNADFPGGLFRPAYGPPNPYDYRLATEDVFGGNPDPSPCFVGPPLPAGNFEAGWKDTAIAYPDQVTKIAVRWAPTDIPSTETDMTKLGFPFDPNHGHGYVWHCHILDHEDSEMMRPTAVWTNGAFPAPRTFVKGVDY